MLTTLSLGFYDGFGSSTNENFDPCNLYTWNSNKTNFGALESPGQLLARIIISKSTTTHSIYAQALK